MLNLLKGRVIITQQIEMLRQHIDTLWRALKAAAIKRPTDRIAILEVFNRSLKTLFVQRIDPDNPLGKATGILICIEIDNQRRKARLSCRPRQHTPRIGNNHQVISQGVGRLKNLYGVNTTTAISGTDRYKTQILMVCKSLFGSDS